DRPFPGADAYEGFALHEDGVGMARWLEVQWNAPPAPVPALARDGTAVAFVEKPASWGGVLHTSEQLVGVGGGAVARGGFFASVDGAPAVGYRAPRAAGAAGEASPAAGAHDRRPVGVITGTYGAVALAPLVEPLADRGVRLVPVENRFFGGNIGVTGLLVGEDIAAVLAGEPEGHRYLLPDVCLSNGAFLDGRTPGDLPRPVEVVATDGAALRLALA
ncbi:MAG: DUF512 domain-containing protein, partial [Acidimicrobiales bacterium]